MGSHRSNTPKYVDLVLNGFLVEFQGEPIDGLLFTHDPEILVGEAEAVNKLMAKGFEIIADRKVPQPNGTIKRYVRMKAIR